ncbi:MAG TPA: helix-turn-helix domain-containing protein [Thermoanaerobaculia bacterium]|nr:helix-turn-helix domain-containing protein [Thermoanaerobaculia bacterium]
MAKKKEQDTAEGRTSGLEQVRALAHPLRLRLFEMFAERPRTTKQAAEELGEAPTRLYHHVAALESAGLVRLCETRRKRGTTEKYFEAVKHRVVTEAKNVPFGDAARRDLEAMGFVVFDRARNELARALAALKDTGHPELLAIRGVFHLTPSAAKKLRKELTELLAGLRRAADAKRGSRSKAKRGRYSLTIALLPTDDAEGAS